MSPGQVPAARQAVGEALGGCGPSHQPPRPEAAPIPVTLVTCPQSTDGKTEAGAGRVAELRKAEDRVRGGMGAGPQMCSHRAGATRGSCRETRGDRPRDARLPARAAQHQADPAPADDQAGLGPPSRPGQLGSGRAASGHLTARGAGGSGRPPTSPRPQLLTAAAPRPPPARSWGPPSRGGAAREPGAQLCLLGGGAARGGQRPVGPTPQVAWGKDARGPSAAEGPASTAVYTLAPTRASTAGRWRSCPSGPRLQPGAGNQLSPPLHPGAGPSPGVFLPPPWAGDLLTILPAPLRPARSGPHPGPGPPSVPTCSPSSSQRLPSDPRGDLSCAGAAHLSPAHLIRES